MAIIKEPDYEMEVQIDQVDVNEELGQVAEHKDVTRWVLGVKMFCRTCEKEMCFDNGWHAGHIFYPHLHGDGCSEDEQCEVEQTVLLGEETTEKKAREEIPDWQIQDG